MRGEGLFLSLSLTASADGRYAGEGAVLNKRTAVHGDSLSVASSGSSSLSATCNIAPRTAGRRVQQRVVMIHFTLAHAMVSARSRYHQHRRLVIRQAISSLLLAAPPPVLSFCLLRCVALLCCSLGQPSSALPLMRATTTATHRPACHRRPAVAHAAYLPRISGAPARSCRRLSLQRTGHE